MVQRSAKTPGFPMIFLHVPSFLFSRTVPRFIPMYRHTHTHTNTCTYMLCYIHGIIDFIASRVCKCACAGPLVGLLHFFHADVLNGFLNCVVRSVFGGEKLAKFVQSVQNCAEMDGTESIRGLFVSRFMFIAKLIRCCVHIKP